MGTPYRESMGNKNVREFSIDQSGSRVFYQDYLVNNKPPCGIGYSYPIVSSSFETFQSQYNNNFKVDVSCGGPAKAEHFPVKNN